MKLTFYGAAGQVTGSKHVLEVGHHKLLLDCGLHQGRHRDVAPLNRELPFDAKSIDACVLSHAHLDHCGLLPLLIKGGFHGHIFCTPATAELAAEILRDSAGIQEEEAIEHGGQPLYTRIDIEDVVQRFKTVPYFRNTPEWTHLFPGVRIKFYDAGHILGSAVTVIETTEGERVKTIGFTGDLGRRQPVLIHDREYVEDHVDALISECTYGEHNHRSAAEVHGEFEDFITRVHKRGGNIVIPAFSLGRTQEVVYALHKLTDEGKVPRMPVYIDSPLATRITEIFGRYAEDFSPQSWQDFTKPHEWPLIFKNLHVVLTHEDSYHLRHMTEPHVVIAASGMCEGGRVVSHIAQRIEDKRNLILFTGYQGVNTLGRQILDGKPRVWIGDRDYGVHAEVGRLYEFSAHGDQADLLDYYQNMKGLKEVFLVHTEPEKATIFKEFLAQKMPELKVGIPEAHQTYEL